MALSDQLGLDLGWQGQPFNDIATGSTTLDIGYLGEPFVGTDQVQTYTSTLTATATSALSFIKAAASSLSSATASASALWATAKVKLVTWTASSGHEAEVEDRVIHKILTVAASSTVSAVKAAARIFSLSQSSSATWSSIKGKLLTLFVSAGSSLSTLKAATKTIVASSATGVTARQRWRVYITADNAGINFQPAIAEFQFRTTAGQSLLFSGGTESASSTQTGQPASMGCDNSVVVWNCWQAAYGQSYAWWEYDYGGGNEKAIVQLSIYSAMFYSSYAPKDFKLQSYNGSTWDDIITVTGETGWTNAGEERLYTWSAPAGASSSSSFIKQAQRIVSVATGAASSVWSTTKVKLQELVATASSSVAWVKSAARSIAATSTAIVDWVGVPSAITYYRTLEATASATASVVRQAQKVLRVISRGPAAWWHTHALTLSLTSSANVSWRKQAALLRSVSSTASPSWLNGIGRFNALVLSATASATGTIVRLVRATWSRQSEPAASLTKLASRQIGSSGSSASSLQKGASRVVATAMGGSGSLLQKTAQRSIAAAGQSVSWPVLRQVGKIWSATTAALPARAEISKVALLVRAGSSTGAASWISGGVFRLRQLTLTVASAGLASSSRVAMRVWQASSSAAASSRRAVLLIWAYGARGAASVRKSIAVSWAAVRSRAWPKWILPTTRWGRMIARRSVRPAVNASVELEAAASAEQWTGLAIDGEVVSRASVSARFSIYVLEAKGDQRS